MSKPKYLKTSFLKKTIKYCLIRLFLLDFYLFKSDKKDKNRLLIITMDALGDNIVKSKIIEILSEIYGKNNTYILCKNKWKILYMIQNYQNIFVDETKWNIFYKIKLYRKLNKIGFNKIAILNHSEIPDESNFIIDGKKYDMSEKVNYILEKHIILLEKIYDKKFTLENLKQDIRKYFPDTKYKNIISIAVAASGDKRTVPYSNLYNYIKKLLELKKDKTIYLLGTGRKQDEIARKLEVISLSGRVVNLVDKIDLKEVIQVIKDSDLFIGGDSGLLNIAFSVRTKSICLHWSKDKYIWEHQVDYIKTLKGAGGEKYIDKKYGTEILNSITFEQIKSAIEKLNIN